MIRAAAMDATMLAMTIGSKLRDERCALWTSKNVRMTQSEAPVKLTARNSSGFMPKTPQANVVGRRIPGIAREKNRSDLE